MKPSHHPSWLSPKSTFLPSLNNSRFQIFSLSRGTFSSSSSLCFLRHKFSLIATSFDKAGKMNTPFSVRTVHFTWAFPKTNLASCSVGSVRSSVRGFFLVLLNVLSRFSSVIWVVTPIRFSTSFTSFVVGTKFSALDFSGSSEFPSIRMIFLIL